MSLKEKVKVYDSGQGYPAWGFPSQGVSVCPRGGVCTQLQATQVRPTWHRPRVGDPGASEPRSLGKSRKGSGRESRKVEGAAAAPKSDGSSSVASSGSKSRSLPPAFQPPPLSNSSSWCDAAQWFTGPANRGEAVKREGEGRRREEDGGREGA